MTPVRAAGSAPEGQARGTSREIPALSELRDRNPGTTAYVLHRAGAAGAPAAGLGAWTPLEGISPYLLFAVVKAEDPRFFRHRGIHWSALARAVAAALRGRPGGGASTITQQLVRNLYLSADRRLGRKAREAALALRVELVLPKARILELYLNVVEWGDGVWGVTDAARRWLDRPPAGIGPFEAALLASMLPAPRRALQGRNANRAWWVQRYVLFQLYNAGYLDLAGWRAGVARATSLCRLTHAGVPVDEALRRLADGLPPTAPGGPVPAVAELLANGCGADVHIPFQQVLARWERVRREDRVRRAAAGSPPPA